MYFKASRDALKLWKGRSGRWPNIRTDRLAYEEIAGLIVGLLGMFKHTIFFHFFITNHLDVIYLA